jgi:hypothetical protein
MTQRFRLNLPAPGTAAADDGSYRIARIARTSVLAAVAVVLVSLVVAAELGLAPEQRVGLLESHDP